VISRGTDLKLAKIEITAPPGLGIRRDFAKMLGERGTYFWWSAALPLCLITWAVVVLRFGARTLLLFEMLMNGFEFEIKND
jgi:hypothetical protein